MITAAALCPAPPLLARELTGTDPVMPELRRACLDAVLALTLGRPDVIVVVGTAPAAGTWDDGASLDLGAFAPALAAGAVRPARPLPPPLGLGALLLDQAGYAGRRVLQAAGADEPAAACAELGATLAGLAGRVALLVMADGSARRTLKAPGYLDERSAPFDAEVERAVRDADLGALLAIDPGLARDLMATGRPGWQVLAGALRGAACTTVVRYAGDPFGVGYLVASVETG